MKNILVVTNHFYPEQFRINDICSELVKKGHNVTVVTQIPNYPSGVFFDGYSKTENRETSWEGVNIKRLWCIPRGSSSIGLILNYLTYWMSTFFYSLFHREDCDTVLAYMTSPIFMVRAAQRLARKANAKMVLYTLDMWPNNFLAVMGIKKNLLTKPLELYCKKTYMRNDLNLVSSEDFIGEITELTRNKNLKFEFLPQHGESVYQFIERPESLQILKNGKLNVTFTGNIGKAQGLDFLIEVAKKLKANDDYFVSFNIVGDGSYLEEFKDLVSKNDLSMYFIFLGRQAIEAISPILSESDLGLISFADEPIYFKTIPAKLQSYIACGVPIITYADGQVNDLVRIESLGYAVKIGEIDSFIDSLKDYQKLSMNDKKNLSNNVKNYFDENYDKNKIIEKLENFL